MNNQREDEAYVSRESRKPGTGLFGDCNLLSRTDVLWKSTPSGERKSMDVVQPVQDSVRPLAKPGRASK